MCIKTLLANPWLILSTAILVLPACNSSYFSVEKSELAALEQCQQSQQSQQYLILQQQTRLDETLSLLQENLELQQRQANMPPPEPAPQPASVVCPKLPKPGPAVSNAQALFQDKQLVGDRERVLLTSIDVLMRARINTGFSMSELDARDIQMFERNGEEWVRFIVIDRETDIAHELERKRLRYIPASAKADEARRPVVELRVTIGKLTHSAEFVLEDRSKQSFPLLIGRNVLRDVMLVDVSRSNLAPVVREAKPDIKDEKESPASTTTDSAEEPASENAQP
jgi:hypothetical protein